jgi:hypothetical protein
MTIEEARERYKRHLAAKQSDKPEESPYYSISGLGRAWKHSYLEADMELLARSACDGEDGSDAARYRDALLNLRRYVACEGYSDGSGTMAVGLAYDGAIWGPAVHPNIQAYELAEAVEKWLHSKIDAAIDAARKGVRG